MAQKNSSILVLGEAPESDAEDDFDNVTVEFQTSINFNFVINY